MPENNPFLLFIIDDDDISREVMGMTLERHGYGVTTAECGKTALAALNAGKEKSPNLILPDLVLMDTQMPGLSGIELIAALRAAGAARIVAISASEPGEAIRNASDGFLLKPVLPEDVAALFSMPVQLAAVSAAEASAGTASSVHPGIDPEVIGKFRAMMPPASVHEIYAATASDMKTRLNSLANAIDASNTAEISRIAHSIKGVCAMVGLTSGRDAAARLEVSNLPVTWPEDLAQLRIALEGLEVMLADDFSA
jgi:CheY-like chemotaxis protein